MKRIAILITCAVIIGGITQNFSIVTVLVAFVLLFEGPRVVSRMRGGKFRLRDLWNIIHFLWDFAFDLAKSNAVLAWDVVTPKDYHEITLIEVPVDDLTDGEIALLSHRITLTPGTLSCLISADRKVLLVHAMYPGEQELGPSLRKPIDILKGKFNA